MNRQIKFTKHTQSRYNTGLVYPESGEVEDTHPWTPKECVAGGIHYGPLRHALCWKVEKHTHVSDITLPEGETRVMHWGTKSKAQRVIIGNMRPIVDLFKTFSDEEIREVIEGMPDLIIKWGVHIPKRFHTRPERVALVQEKTVRQYPGVTVTTEAGALSGEFTVDHRFLGLRIQYHAGVTFTCERFDGLAQGRGTLTLNEGTYTGTFVDGLMQGDGECRVTGWAAKTVVTRGTLVDGSFDGAATVTQEGTTVAAHFRDGHRINEDGTPYRAKCTACNTYH